MKSGNIGRSQAGLKPTPIHCQRCGHQFVALLPEEDDETVHREQGGE